MRYFQPLEIVGRGSETQIQVAENVNKLTYQDKCKYIIWGSVGQWPEIWDLWVSGLTDTE